VFRSKIHVKLSSKSSEHKKLLKTDHFTLLLPQEASVLFQKKILLIIKLQNKLLKCWPSKDVRKSEFSKIK